MSLFDIFMQAYSNNVSSRQIIDQATCGPQLLEQQNLCTAPGLRPSAATLSWWLGVQTRAAASGFAFYQRLGQLKTWVTTICLP